jgi:hypothetical protein
MQSHRAAATRDAAARDVRYSQSEVARIAWQLFELICAGGVASVVRA